MGWQPDGVGSASSPSGIDDGLGGCPSRSLALEAGAGVLGRRGVDLDSAVVVGPG